jgi:exopolyphosphatase/guanosine-5'-triphosphate,3'-diphosphate pyrophosphatase
LRIAVVDLGSNSTRLLVADVEGGAVTEVERRTNVTRLGDGVDATGRLSDAAIERVLETLAGYREAIDALGAERIVAVATSAVRDADNGAELQAALRDRYGIDARVIPGEHEARLTFLGATAGRTDGETLVIDIGGGSTELVVGRPGSEPEFHVSARLGVVRQTERHLADDPPPPDQRDALAREAAAIVAAEVPEDVRAGVRAAIAVAGTATSLAAIDQRLEPYDPERVHGYELTPAGAERMLEELAAMPLAERREVPGLHPDRAPTIVAGALILIAAMRAFGIDRVEVSEADLLHGAALEAAAGSG